jgi:CTP synthase
MQEQGLDVVTLSKMDMPTDGEPELGPWIEFLQKQANATGTVKIGLVGKYVELPDAYKSINESLMQAAIYNDKKLKLTFIHSEKLNDSNAAELLSGMDGLLIAPGFGQRGIDGKFAAIKYARQNDVPTLGVCLGMQCMVIEYARNVLGFEDANSTEMDTKTPFNVIDLMEEQKGITNMGGTMRLGAYDCELEAGSKAALAYKNTLIQERHRHRFEFNNKYKADFENAGMSCVGHNPDTGLVEVVEIPSLKWFVGVQYHPEYNSTVLKPNPLFIGFVKAAIANQK